MPAYLDHNATTRPLPEVVEAVRAAMAERWANPSSVHRAGMEARRAVDEARDRIARLVGCQPRELILTSGGTEAANLAILGTLELAGRERRLLVTSRLEHSAVRETAEAWIERGGEVAWVEHAPDGRVDLDALAARLDREASRIGLVSLLWANNETGVISDIPAIGALCRERGVTFHSDATQWVGKRSLDLAAEQIDLLSFAAHKFHGPKGVGALYVRRGVGVARQVFGGPQERDRRGGTENVPGIVGMGVAAELAAAWLAGGEAERLAAERDRLERTIVAATGAVVNGAGAPRLWNTTNLGFARLEAEAMLLLLSERGVAASAGAACSSGSLDPSPVLLAMGVPPEVAHGSIRFSLGRDTTAAEIDAAIAATVESVARLRGSSASVIGR